jgi:hypothetical protein
VVDWNQPVSAGNSNQWGNLLQAVNELRDSADESPNTYYYGMFNGEASIDAYCRFGCILGLSLLAPPNGGPYFRASIGVGFSGQYSAETLVHEVGHAHGRDHAPCGLSDADRQYPYAGAEIGSWGYDLVDGRFYDPDVYVDMMSYCSPIWVSDYTYFNLVERIQTVSRQPRAMPASRQTVALAADGTTLRAGRMNVLPGVGAPVALDLYDADGRHAGVGAGSFFAYDHIEGGIVALDEDLPEGWTAVAQALPAR